MKNRVMLDLETMSTESNAAIISIGAVRFTPERVTDKFYAIVDLQSSVDLGGDCSVSTFRWWLKQSDEARAEFEKTGHTLCTALQDFTKWLGTGAEVWGNGAAFDNVILANAYKRAGLAVPWDFRADRCYRTVVDLRPSVPAIARGGVAHNAVDDAEYQALHLIAMGVLL